MGQSTWGNQCLGIIATLAQNNPPVQKQFLELGAIKILSDLFLQLQRGRESTPSCLSTKTKIMQALSAIIRGYDLTESVFEELPQAPFLMREGLSTDPTVSNASLRMKTLFFFKAFLTSDNATNARATTFQDAITMIIAGDRGSEYYLSDNSNTDGVHQQLRELAIALLSQLLERRLVVTLLLQHKHHLAALGVHRIQSLRQEANKGD